MLSFHNLTDFSAVQAYTEHNEIVEERSGGAMVYIDAVWCLNLLMDGMILHLTSLLTKTHSSGWRTISAAFFASLMVPLAIYAPDSFVHTLPGKLMVSVVIILIAFSYRSLTSFLMKLITFYFVTFAIGGTLLGLHFFINSSISVSHGHLVTFSGGYGDPVSWGLVLLGFPLSWWATKWRMEHAVYLKLKHDQIYSTELQWKQQTIHVKGFVDSGNHLIDPVSRGMIFLAGPSVFLSFLTEKEWTELQDFSQDYDLEKLPNDLQEKVRLIPYQGAGSPSRLMIVIQLDGLVVDNGQGCITHRHPLIGIQFSDLTTDGAYDVLLHPHLMVKGKVA
ncbi:sigma-E processing peptidase SpoIIGA [Thalassobacillus sp. CUG 92003]|uniref:sigma-E processing peptidase SpoIIGA n=1 Tax=Thalassobacillus sp. CUG 92003 TaxID=2736641 RepID=UPI0015E7CFB0|nr:sigma-E processing peptidase SpoIIGA [Thalassobacillus sp. CUG 92003]